MAPKVSADGEHVELTKEDMRLLLDWIDAAEARMLTTEACLDEVAP